MALGDLKTFEIEYPGLKLQVIAIDLGNGQVTFDVRCLEGKADINAIYWNDGDATGGEGTRTGFTGLKNESSLNMNGQGGEVWDGGYKISNPGLGSTYKASYLTADPSDGQPSTYSFTTSLGISWESLDGLGLRATSTSTAEGSIKGVDGDDTEIKAPKVSIDDAECVVEGGVATFTITLDHAYAYDVRVEYTTAHGTAGSSDYTTTSSYVIIPAGQTSSSPIQVQTTDDTDYEPGADETFFVNISNATADIPGPDIAITIADAQGEGCIKDNDAPPPPVEHFPDNGHALSTATFYFATTAGDVRGSPSGNGGANNNPDGVYTVKIEFPSGIGGNDLDDHYQAILNWIIANDPNVGPETIVLGVAIHAGIGAPGTSEVFYAIDGNELDVDVLPTPPGDLATNNEIDSTQSGTPNLTINYDHIFPLA